MIMQMPYRKLAVGGAKKPTGVIWLAGIHQLAPLDACKRAVLCIINGLQCGRVADQLGPRCGRPIGGQVSRQWLIASRVLFNRRSRSLCTHKHLVA